MNPICGERIQQAREIRGVTRERFASLIHKTKQEVVRYETDLDEPSIETLERIAIVLSWPIGFFRQPPPPNFGLGSMIYHYDFKE